MAALRIIFVSTYFIVPSSLWLAVGAAGRFFAGVRDGR